MLTRVEVPALLITLAFVAVASGDLETDARVAHRVLLLDGPDEEAAKQVERVLARLPGQELGLALAVLLGVVVGPLRLERGEPVDDVLHGHARRNPFSEGRRHNVLLPPPTVVIGRTVARARPQELSPELCNRPTASRNENRRRRSAA